MTDSAGSSKCQRSTARVLEGLLIAPLCWAPTFWVSLLFDRWVVTRAPYTGGLEIAVVGCLMGTLAAYLAASVFLPIAVLFRNRLTAVLFASGATSLAVSYVGAMMVNGALARGRPIAAESNFRLTVAFSVASLACCVAFALHQLIRNPRLHPSAIHGITLLWRRLILRTLR